LGVRVARGTDKKSPKTRVRREFSFEVEGGAELLTERVVQALWRYVSEGEWEDIRSSLPKELAQILPA
jgi:uncharacterized protein (DUF2267 family)